MKWISKLIGICIMLISIPFILVFLPFKYLKMRKRASASKLFTSHEKALLYKSQQLIKMDETAIIKYDEDLLTMARLIEDSRIEYQLMNELERSEIAFIEFLLPRIELLKLDMADWENVNKYFDIER
jgi:hypothetical protein